MPVVTVRVGLRLRLDVRPEPPFQGLRWLKAPGLPRLGLLRVSKIRGPWTKSCESLQRPNCGITKHGDTWKNDDHLRCAESFLLEAQAAHDNSVGCIAGWEPKPKNRKT